MRLVVEVRDHVVKGRPEDQRGQGEPIIKAKEKQRGTSYIWTNFAYVKACIKKLNLKIKKTKTIYMLLG